MVEEIEAAVDPDAPIKELRRGVALKPLVFVLGGRHRESLAEVVDTGCGLDLLAPGESIRSSEGLKMDTDVGQRNGWVSEVGGCGESVRRATFRHCDWRPLPWWRPCKFRPYRVLPGSSTASDRYQSG